MSPFRARKVVLLFCVCAAMLAAISGCSSKKEGKIKDLAQQQVEELYNKAKSAMRKGNYAFAIQYYQALESNFPYGEYTEQAKLDMLYAYDKSGKVEEAVEAADNFIKLYPTHKNVDYAYYMKGVASFEKKKSALDMFMRGGKKVVRDPQPYRDSLAAFNDLINRYPQSIYAEDARQRIVFIQNALAERELKVAQFYFDSKTYVAAVNRCKTIIYSYETSPAVEGALVLMEKAYLEMGLQDLAASTHSVLVENFPDYEAEPFKTRKKGFFSRLNPF
ncbi:MAG: outer membrane protein assembly factor BamD [Gammaproteobacteria bacterium]|nr:outer membrane protein assembly factor BamD [Gammaproteobacteria bacterium]